MHTVMVIAGGLLLLTGTLLASHWIGGRWIGGGDTAALLLAAKLFLPVWLILAAANGWVGVVHAGYSPAAELAILLPVFGVPAAAALAVMWCFSRP
jgi:hypothetical protein